MKIAVIGLGKIGLPLAVQYARRNHEVYGVDINSKTVDLVNKGEEPFPEENRLQEFLRDTVNRKKLRATLSYHEAVSNADAIIVVVPLLVDENRQPDFTAIDSATESIAKSIKRGVLICYETTLPIGTTRNRFTPILERISNLAAGLDFHVVFSPERVFTGRIFDDLKKYPKIVGGVTEKCGLKGVSFYENVLEFVDRKDLEKPNGVWLVKNCEAAEFVKLAETTYRDVNIALANEFAMHAEAEGVDIYEIITAANSQTFSHIHQPGISVGGHCIPVYPQFYIRGDKNSNIVKVTRIVNERMPLHVVLQIKKDVKLFAEKNVLILGLSYRPNVKESAFSGAFELVKLLEKECHTVQILDPYFEEHEVRELGLVPYDGVLDNLDVIILHTSHQQFGDFFNQKFPSDIYIYDGRNFFNQIPKPTGVKIHTLGRGLEHTEEL